MAKFKDLFQELSNTPEYKAAELQADIAHMVEAAMEMKSMSKADLANELGCTRAYVTKALRGDNNFSILSLSKLACAMDCEVKVALMPKAIFSQLAKKIGSIIEQQEQDRKKIANREVRKVREQERKVIDLQEYINGESVYLAA